jgi:L-alanine-DL-glutamate epimerase-like enolase superfamily enzyme
MAADRSVLAESTITRLQVQAPAGVVRISAEGAGEEVCGAGLICPDRLPPAATVDRVRTALVGRQLADRERLWRDLRAAAAGSDPTGLAGVDIALWDLWSKALGLPLYRAIGGFRTEIPACLSGEAACDSDDAAAEAAGAVRDGYRGYRVTGTATPIGAKVPAAVRKRVLDAIRAVREAVPSDFPLLYRGGPAGGHLEALGIGRALDEAGYTWFEDPLPGADGEALGRLAADLDTPVLATVGGPDAARQAAAHLSRQSADLIRVRIPDVGGITEALKIARAAEAFGVNCEIDPDDDNGGFAAAGLMGALRNAMFLLWVTGDRGDRARTAGGLIRTPMSVRHGAVTLGDVPGVGIDLDLERTQ